MCCCWAVIVVGFEVLDLGCYAGVVDHALDAASLRELCGEEAAEQGASADCAQAPLAAVKVGVCHDGSLAGEVDAVPVLALSLRVDEVGELRSQRLYQVGGGTGAVLRQRQVARRAALKRAVAHDVDGADAQHWVVGIPVDERHQGVYAGSVVAEHRVDS